MGKPVTRKEVMNTLQTVMPGVAKEPTYIEQGASFVFDGGRVHTFNDRVSVSAPLVGITKGRQGAVSAKALYNLLKKMKEEEITVDFTKAEMMIQSGDVKLGISYETEIKRSYSPEAEVKQWVSLPDDFLDALVFCAPFAQEEENTLLSCVRVLCSEKGSRCEATDRYIGGCRSFSASDLDGEETFLMPVTAVKMLRDYAVSEVGFTPGWVHFRGVNELVFSSVLVAGPADYPDLMKLISDTRDTKGYEVVFPDALKDSLPLLDEVAKANIALMEQNVVFRYDKKGIKVSAKGELGWMTQTVPVTDNMMPEGSGFTVRVDFLREILTLGVVGKVLADNKLVLFETDTWSCIVSLVVSD